MIQLSLWRVLAIDLCTLLLCSFIALRCVSSLVHPALMMLGCHGYIVTFRLFQLIRGATPMAFTFVWPVTVDEVMRAAVASDVALLAMAAAWILVRFRPRNRQVREPRTLLSFRRVRAIAFLSMVSSLCALALLGPAQLPLSSQAGETSGYIGAALGWAPWACCLLHYLYGFPVPLLCLTGVTLVSSMMMNTFRGVVIIPLVFLLFTWLSRRKSRGVPIMLLPAAVILWLIWLPMKPIVYSLQAGKSISEAFSYGISIAFGNFGVERGSGIDFEFLDMIGSTMTLVDIHGGHYWGSTLAPLIVSPVPRALWPEKPHLNQYQRELDIPSRNMAQLNMTAGLVGESYANFGYFGVILIPFLISFAFSAAYSRLAGTTVLSPGGLLYLIYLSTFMQLYRDGLISAVWFPFVHCAPMGWTAVSHWLWPPGRNYRPAQQTGPLADRFEYLPL